MTGSLRSIAIALAVLIGAIAACALFSSEDPHCSSGPVPGGELVGCSEAPEWLHHQPMGLLVLAILVFAVAAAGFILLQAIAHHRSARGLQRLARPAWLAGESVGLVPGHGIALVAGLRQPRIFCSEDLDVVLNADELRAVLLHERHHQLTHAPTQLVVLSGLAQIVGRIGRGRVWVDGRRARIEIAADAHALRSGASRSTLAAALLKLDGLSPSTSLAAMGTASELRVRALLGEPPPPPDRFLSQALAAGVGTASIVAVLCLILCVAF